MLAKTNLPTLNHVAFEMPDFNSVMRGMGRMKDNGYPIEWGPGRHGPGNNVFAYFCGPDEVPIEYTSDVLQIDDRYVPRGSDYWKFPPGRSDHWGITQPRSARYYRVQRLFGFTEDGYRLGGSADWVELVARPDMTTYAYAGYAIAGAKTRRKRR